jgi:hypothetical protein
MHALRVWVADAAGNISNGSATTGINYLPAQARVREGQVRIYRLTLAVGDVLSAGVMSLSGDADIYIWDDAGSMIAHSNLYDTEPDLIEHQVVRAGVYQIEIHGFEESEYTLTLTPGTGRSARVASDKVLPGAPVVAATSGATAQQALPSAPALETDRAGSAFLPFVVNVYSPVLPNDAPDVEILSPRDGDLFVGAQPIVFEGSATDQEDGPLSGDSLVWRSTLDGEVGTGALLRVEAARLSEGVHTITLSATDSAGSSANASVTIQVVRDAPLNLPDLVVQEIVVTENSVQVTIANVGDAAVPSGHDFWVDVYIDPHTPPTQVNEIWNFQGDQGLVWGVVAPAVPMQPGDTLTLSIGDGFYWPSLSAFSGSIPPGTPVYAQVDSANEDTTYGNVLEGHEQTGRVYNNIFGPVVRRDASGTSQASQPADTQNLSAEPEEEPTTEATLPFRPQRARNR